MRLADSAATEAVGAALAGVIAVGDIVALSGELGSGKTTLGRGFLRALGLTGEAPSPSFAIVQPYAPPETQIAVWHVDLYRLEDADEVAELGLEEALESAVLLVEWPERAGCAAWPEALRLHLVADGDGRRLTAVVPAAWEGRWPPR